MVPAVPENVPGAWAPAGHLRSRWPNAPLKGRTDRARIAGALWECGTVAPWGHSAVLLLGLYNVALERCSTVARCWLCDRCSGGALIIATRVVIRVIITRHTENHTGWMPFVASTDPRYNPCSHPSSNQNIFAATESWAS